MTWVNRVFPDPNAEPAGLPDSASVYARDGWMDLFSQLESKQDVIDVRDGLNRLLDSDAPTEEA